MPQGPPRRKPSKKKKKKKTKADKRSHPPHGESEGDQNNSPHQMVNMEDSSSGSESLTTKGTPQAAQEKLAKIETNSIKQTKIEIEKAAMIRPDSVADYLSQPSESSPDTQKDSDLGFKTPPERGTHKDSDLGFKTPPEKGIHKDSDFMGFKTPPEKGIHKDSDFMGFKTPPETGTHKDSDLGFKTPSFVDPVTPVAQSLVEVASQLSNNAKIQEQDDLVAADTHLEHTVINETGSNNNQLLKENEVQKLDSKSDKASPKSKQEFLHPPPPHLEHTVINETGSNSNQMSKEDEVQKLDSKSDKASPKSKQEFLHPPPPHLEHTVINETGSNNNQLLKENEVKKLDSKSNKASPKSKQKFLQDSRNCKCPYYVRSGDDRVNEPMTPECTERQPLIASAPRPCEKSSWKNCCGIFELFSGSTRN